jgi:hypothetical protein
MKRRNFLKGAATAIVGGLVGTKIDASSFTAPKESEERAAAERQLIVSHEYGELYQDVDGSYLWISDCCRVQTPTGRVRVDVPPAIAISSGSTLIPAWSLVADVQTDQTVQALRERAPSVENLAVYTPEQDPRTGYYVWCDEFGKEAFRHKHFFPGEDREKAKVSPRSTDK